MSRPVPGLVLHVVEVGLAVGDHDDVVLLARGGDPAFGAAPRHDHGVGRQAAFEDLVPSDQLSPLGVEEPLHPLGEVALQLVFALEPLFLHPRLRERAGLPAVAGHLVSARVDVGAGEQLDHFAQHTLDELEHLLLAGVHDLLRDAPLGPDLERPAGARQLRVAGQRGLAVTRHADAGHHGDVPLAGVAHDLADVVLREKAAVALVVALAIDVMLHGAGAPGPDLRELGISLDLDAPALVVRQVEVKGVDLPGGQEVDVSLDELLVEEVPGDVEAHASPREAGLVFDVQAWNRAAARAGGRGTAFRRQELAERLDTVENACRLRRPNHDRLGRDREFVPLLAKRPLRIDRGQQDGVPGRHAAVRHLHRHGAARALGHALCQPATDRPQLLRPACHRDSGACFRAELPFSVLQAHGLGDDRHLRWFRVAPHRKPHEHRNQKRLTHDLVSCAKEAMNVTADSRCRLSSPGRALSRFRPESGGPGRRSVVS